jgi:MFS family permease
VTQAPATSAASEGHPTIFGTIRTMAGPVKVLMLGTFVNNLASFLNAFLVLFLTHHRGISSTYAGLALTALLVGRIVGTAIGGGIADRVGYRWTIIGSTFLAGAATVTLVQMSSPWVIIGVAGLAGIVLQAYRPASIAWIVQLTPERSHVLVFSIYRLAFNVGATVGPLAGALIVKYSYDLLFYANAATELSFGLVALLFLPSDSTGKKSRAGRPDGQPAAQTAAEAAAATAPARGYRAMLTDSRFMLVIAGLFFTAVAYIQIASALPLFVTGTGYSTNDYAILLSLNGAMVIAFEVVLTKWTQRIPIGLPMAGGMALLSIGHFLYLYPAGLGGLAVATFVWTLGEIVAAPSMLAYPGLSAPAGLTARYIAGATVAQQLGYAAGPIIGVTAWQMWGSKVWLVTGACAAVATVLTIIGAGFRRRAAAESPDPTATATALTAADRSVTEGSPADQSDTDQSRTDASAAGTTGTTPNSSSVSA